MSLVYNPATKSVIDRTLHNLPHALLLEGDVGVGLLSIARDIAWHDVADIIIPTLAENSTSKHTEIRINQIRELIRATRGKSTKRMIYIIDEADTMGHSAQNAFLKLLEEPPEHTSFILTSHTPQQLLPTIRSRVQTIHVQPITTEQSKKLITDAKIDDPRKVQQLLFIANGKPAELKRLIDNPKQFTERAQIVADAREYLQGSAYQKAMVIQRYASDRPAALRLIEQTIQLLLFGMTKQPSALSISRADQLSRIYDRIAANGNVRLQLTTFVV